MSKNYGISVVRIGLSLVYLWFGSNQLMHPEKWTSLIPSYATKIIPVSAHALVLGNGGFEIVFGLLLLVGFYSRFAAFVSWILYISIVNRNPMLYNFMNSFIGILIFWSIFLPLGARYSFDNLKAKCFNCRLLWKLETQVVQHYHAD